MSEHKTYSKGKKNFQAKLKFLRRMDKFMEKNQNPKGVRCQFVNWWPTLIAVVEKLL